jgi:preprotein translocase subunit YajC
LVRRLGAATLRQLAGACPVPRRVAKLAIASAMYVAGRGMSTEGCPAMGNEILAAASTTGKSSSGSYLFLVAIVVLFGLLYFVTIRPQRARQRAAAQTQRDVVPGTLVRTTAGMYATVVSIENQDVVLEIAPGVQVRYLRRAILDVVPDATEAAEPAPETLDEDDAAKGG